MTVQTVQRPERAEIVNEVPARGWSRRATILFSLIFNFVAWGAFLWFVITLAACLHTQGA